MTVAPPMAFTWDGTVMVPRHARLADKYYVVGDVYSMEVREERSIRSHNFYFASVAEAWSNLPEHLAERFPSADHLRRYALIKAGFADERSIVCSSPAEAARIAAFIQPMDTYAVVTVSDYVVRVFTAQSQSYKTMDKDTFQKSKEAVLGIISDMIGVTRRDLEKASA